MRQCRVCSRDPRATRPGVALLLVVMTAGCGGDSIKLTDVSGKATFDGQPIVYGQINFVPDPNQQHEGPAGYAEIVDGVYDTSQGGKGIVPGAYQVRITAFPSRPPVTTTETTEDVPVEPAVKPLFVGYTLAANIQPPQHDIDVPAAAQGFDVFVDPTTAAGGNLP